MVRKMLRVVGIGFGALVVLTCLVTVLAPACLDQIYYRGPVTGHFDGRRFANPDNDEDTARPPTGGSRAGFFWNYLTGNDGRPDWPARVAVQQTEPVARVYGDRMVATWIGHATVLVQTNGLNILTDPVYSETAGPFGFGPKRVAVPGVKFEDLPKIDLILVSHNHYDHMDLATLKRLWDRDRPRIITSLGNDEVIRRAGIPLAPLGGARLVNSGSFQPGIIALDWGDMAILEKDRTLVPLGPPAIDGKWSQQPEQASVVVTRNHHWGSRWFADRNRALWSSFVVQLPGGNLFFTGDTGFGDGEWPAEGAALGPIRLALIPIGAFRFQAGQMQTGSHIGPGQAVEVFRRLGARYAMPIHWGTFRLSWEGYDTPPKLLDRVMMCRGLSDFTAYPIGTQVDVPPIDVPRAKLPPVPRPASCDARPFAPDLR